jgi:hypothetical protein
MQKEINEFLFANKLDEVLIQVTLDVEMSLRVRGKGKIEIAGTILVPPYFCVLNSL